MKIEVITKGKCAFCKKPAVRKIDGEFYCGHCADNRLLKQMKRCVEAMSEAIVTIKILPKLSLEKGMAHGKEDLRTAQSGDILPDSRF
jgi:hypothetical protein